MKKRVVITGLGIVAPNGVGLDAFNNALKNGTSGIKHDAELERLQFSCQISGKPEISTELALHYFTELELRNFNSSGILYGVIAAIDAWNCRAAWFVTRWHGAAGGAWAYGGIGTDAGDLCDAGASAAFPQIS